MDQLLHKVSRKVQGLSQQHSSQSPTPKPSGLGELELTTCDRSQGHFRQGLPDFVFQAVDKYVDSLAPQISPIITKEIESFQTQTIDSLEAHLKDAFRSVFAGDLSAFRQVRDLDQLVITQQRSENVTITQPPNSYGQRGLPIAPSAPNLWVARSGSQERSLSGGQIILSAITAEYEVGSKSGGDMEAAQRERNIFQEALGKVSGFAKTQSDCPGLGVELKRFMNKMATDIDKVKVDPDEMAKKILPELRTRVGEVLTKQHAHLAEQMTAAALGQLKKWLRGNTSVRDLGSGVKGDITDAMAVFFEKSSISPHLASPGSDLRGGVPTTRSPSTEEYEERTGAAAEPIQPHGVAGILSKKLSRGLTHVRSCTRDDFRLILSAIEKTLFDELPESIRGPLAKLFGGDPFDPLVQLPPSLDRNGRSVGERGFDIFQEIGDKFKAIVECVQKGLRDRVLEVVGGGHRRLETLAWMQVQETVVLKVRKYVPGISVDVEDEEQVAGESSTM
jgi:hypothetical protein